MKPTILIVTGVAALIIQMIYFIKDDRTPNESPRDKLIKKLWHFAGGAIHGWMYFVIADQYGAEWGLLMATCTWLLFDGFINTYALGKEFLYIGNTAFIDIVQQKAAKLLHIDVRLLTASLKALLFIAAIYSLFKKYWHG
jgi:hypothetical protein